MIKSLYVKNFILIDELTIDFSDGFNVITGETGAGKSIILSAIDIALGSKFSKEIIKTNSDKAIIELVIDLPENFDFQLFSNNQIDPAKQIILSKEITISASRSRINGIIVSNEFIKELKEKIIDINTQNQAFLCLQPKFHIKMLDNFASDEFQNLLTQYQQTYFSWIEAKKEFDIAKNSNEKSQNEIEFLKFQIKEIEEAQIEDVNEDNDLDEELLKLSNAQELCELLNEASYSIYYAEPNIIDAISKVNSSISKASEFDASLCQIYNEVFNTQELLKDYAKELKSKAENISSNPQRKEEIEDRIAILNNLKRKYGNTLELVLEEHEKFKNKLAKINFSDEKIKELKEKIDKLFTQINFIAPKLTAMRLKNAKNLSEKITTEMQKLEMPKSRFGGFVKKIDFNENGADNVEFQITTNISEPLKPLNNVASGGELSRIMLALKTVLAQKDEINTIIFDEIDTGISGTASQAVANELSTLSKSHQIILITHQPIIASRADKHFYVTKEQKDKTIVSIRPVEADERFEALAMLAGGKIDEQTLEFVKALT